MEHLSREAILATRADLPRETVEVPEWGGSVIVQTMAGSDRDEIEGRFFAGGGDPNIRGFRAWVAAACIVDENGDRIFSNSDAEELGLLSAVALDRVFEVANRLSGLTAAGIGEIEGNSSGVPSDEHGSD